MTTVVKIFFVSNRFSNSRLWIGDKMEGHIAQPLAQKYAHVTRLPQEFYKRGKWPDLQLDQESGRKITTYYVLY